MQKFFRKHMKKLLAIFMGLLLVCWLGGDALTALVRPDPFKSVEVTSRFGDVTGAERVAAANRTALMEILGLPWSTPLGRVRGSEALLVYDWMMLVREAQQMGISVRLDDAKQALERMGSTTDRINSIAVQRRCTPEALYAAAAEYIQVTKAIGLVAEAAQVSEAEVRLAARDSIEKIKIDLVALKADSFADEDATFTDAELTAQFEKYADQKRGKGMSFGYFREPRVKAQYLRVDVEKVKAALSISESTLERRAREFWKENKTDPAFLRPRTIPQPTPVTNIVIPPADQSVPDESVDTSTPPADDATEDGEGSPVPGGGELDGGQAEQTDSTSTDASEQPEETPTEPAEQPSTVPPPAPVITPPTTTPPPAPSRHFETWSEAREAARDAVLKNLAARRAYDVANYIAEEAAEPWFDATPGEDGYKEQPAGADNLALLEEIIANLPVEYRYNGAVTTATTDWFTQQDAASVPEVGAAYLLIPGGGRQGFSQLSFLIKGLTEIPKVGADRSLYLTLYETSQAPLSDSAGNLYLYRPIGIEPGRAANSLDEVRDEVVADLRVQRAYDEAQRLGEALLSEAQVNGLKSAWEADTALQDITAGVGFYEATPFARLPLFRFAGNQQSVTGLGRVEETFIQACFELGSAEAGLEQYAVIPVPDLAAVAIVQWKEIQPLREDQYAKERPRFLRQVQGQRTQKLISEWLDPELIRSRNGFRYANQSG